MPEHASVSLAAVQALEAAYERFARQVAARLPVVRGELARAMEALEECELGLRQEAAQLRTEILQADEEEDVASLVVGLEDTRDRLSEIRSRQRSLAEVRTLLDARVGAVEPLAQQGAVQAREFLRGVIADVKAILAMQPDHAGARGSGAFNSMSQSSNTPLTEWAGGGSDGPSNSSFKSGLTKVLVRLGILGESEVGATQMVALREALRQRDRSEVSGQIAVVTGAHLTGPLSESEVVAAAEEFLCYVSPEIAQSAPRLRITIDRLPPTVAGLYRGKGWIALNTRKIPDTQRLREVLFHEMGHWLHESAAEEHRRRIRAHFEERTAGEAVVSLPGYSPDVLGKVDSWADSYAGRVYSPSPESMGEEIPSCHFEFLAQPPEQMAMAWNDATYRETLLIVLEGLYGQ